MKLKRILLTALVLSLTLCALFVTASAADIVDSGKCGGNLTWELDADGVLSISGTGEMYDYSSSHYSPSNPSYAPWFEYQSGIETVKIQSGVSSIGRYAFFECHFITSISIPNSVTSIGAYAFQECSSLTKVTLPNSITTIDFFTFSKCTSLTSINIPDKVTSIGDYAFGDCTSLTKVTFPNGLANIGNGAFSGCSSLTSIKIPESVTRLNAHVFFMCDKLTSIRIPRSVTSIGSSAFASLAGPKLISFEDKAPVFADDTFKFTTATCAYPCNGFGWVNTINSNYGGTITWKKVHSNPVGTVTAPTCTEDGYTTYTCDCGDRYKDNYVDALGHKYWNGKCSACETEDPNFIPPAITTQPKNTYVKMGSTAKVTVVAEGEGLEYQWYFKNAGQTKYTKSSVTSASYSTTMRDAAKDRRVYCVVTDKYGNSVKSNTVIQRLAASVATQPKSVVVAKDKIAKVTLKAVGDGLKYEWYYKDKGATSFKKTTAFTGNSYSVAMTAARHGRQLYCKVTDKYGKTVKTNTVTISMKAAVTAQPKSVVVAKGATAKVTVKAAGDGLKYEWYYKDKGATSFKKTTSFTGTSYTAEMTAARHGRQIYCKITDKYGNTVKTNTVTISMKATVTTQPKSVTVAKGATARVSFKAVGNGLTYTWYYKDAGATSFKKTTAFTGTSYSVEMTEARSGRQIYCKVTDKYGNTVKTNTVTLKMK